MDIKTILQNEFKQIKNVFLEKEAKNLFLRVEIAFSSLNDVVEYSKKISAFLDEKNLIDKDFFLDVYSSGTEKIIELETLDEYIGKNVIVFLKEEFKNLKKYEGILLENLFETIIIKFNAKGLIKKITIEKNNIEKIQFSAKL